MTDDQPSRVLNCPPRAAVHWHFPTGRRQWTAAWFVRENLSERLFDGKGCAAAYETLSPWRCWILCATTWTTQITAAERRSKPSPRATRRSLHLPFKSGRRAQDQQETTPMKKIHRYVCTLALTTAIVLAITTAPASGSDATQASTSANTVWVADPTEATGSTTGPSDSRRVWEW
jgi:hypothetical protein